MQNTNSTIMVVDDYEDTRFLLRQVLEMKGYRVVEAATGRDAVEVACRERPNLILMDLNLPVFDGLVATDLLRACDGLRDVPIVAMTAYDTADHRADAADAGCTEYLAKPIDFDQLDKLLNRLLVRTDALQSLS